jgi:hypothetical protein
MEMLMSSLILAVVVSILIYLLFFNNGKPSLIPYVKNGDYPFLGFLYPYFADRTNFVMDCRRRYGSCFAVKLLNQKLIFVLSPSDWPTIVRNQSLYFPSRELGMKVFDTCHHALGKFESLN